MRRTTQQQSQPQQQKQITTTDEWIPKIGDKVGVMFEHKDKERNVENTEGKHWYCGKVMQINLNKKEAYIQFLQGTDEGWYPYDREMRPCPPKHTCTPDVCYKLKKRSGRLATE